MTKKSYNDVWLMARQEQRTIQGGVLCTYADIFAPAVLQTGGNIESGLLKFSFQKKDCPFTLIEDAWEKELRWLGGGACPFQFIDADYAADYVSKHKRDFYNPATLHVGRLTGAALEVMQYSGYTLLDEVAENPYVLYRPDRYQWAFPVEDNKEVTVESKSEEREKRSNLLWLGLAATAMLNMF